ncbi:hypothetical protein ACSQ67_005377 [Phaseolus vulgaris]
MTIVVIAKAKKGKERCYSLCTSTKRTTKRIMEGGSGEKWKSVYRECLRNHAASLGSYATDGCGEFTLDSGGLQCAACGCHRNFHRKVKYPVGPESPGAMDYGGEGGARSGSGQSSAQIRRRRCWRLLRSLVGSFRGRIWMMRLRGSAEALE